MNINSNLFDVYLNIRSLMSNNMLDPLVVLFYETHCSLQSLCNDSEKER